MSHLLYELEDYLEERALAAHAESRASLLRRLSVLVGHMGSGIDSAVVSMKHVVRRR